MLNELAYRIDDVNYMVTLNCPGRCVYCRLWETEKSQVTAGELEPELCEKLLKSRLLDGVRYFDLTGGESQLSSMYGDVVRMIATTRPEAFVHTNISGWYTNRHVSVTEECLEHVDAGRFRVDVSMDGRPEVYEKVRLVYNGWNKAVETTRALRDLGIIVRFAFVVHRLNFQDIEWIEEFAASMEVGYTIGFSRKSNLLRNTATREPEFSTREIDQIEGALNRIGYLDSNRKNSWLWAKSVYADQVPFFDCQMGRRALVIDPYGNVFPCNDLLPPLNMGNLRDFNGDLDSLLVSKRALSVMGKVQERGCQPCGILCAHKTVFPWGSHPDMSHDDLSVPTSRDV